MTTRARMNAHLPAGYFADSPTLSPAGSEAGQQEARSLAEAGVDNLAALENLGRSEQSGAELREGSGGSGAAITSFARHAAGVWHQAYAVAARRIEHGQQLWAARTIFGQLSTKPHGSR